MASAQIGMAKLTVLVIRWPLTLAGLGSMHHSLIAAHVPSLHALHGIMKDDRKQAKPTTMSLAGPTSSTAMSWAMKSQA